MREDEDVRPITDDDDIPVTVEAEEASRAAVVMARAVTPALIFIALTYAVAAVGGRFGLSAPLCRAVVRAAVLAVIIVLWKRGSIPSVSFGCSTADAVRAAGAGVLMQISLAFLVSLFASVTGPAAWDAGTVAAFTVSVTLTPLCEELIFRAVAFTEIMRCAPVWVAAAISSLLFALVHPSAVTAGAAFIAGIPLAYMLRRTGSVTVPVIAHASFNAASYLIAFVPVLPFPVRLATGILSAAGAVGLICGTDKQVK